MTQILTLTIQVAKWINEVFLSSDPIAEMRKAEAAKLAGMYLTWTR